MVRLGTHAAFIFHGPRTSTIRREIGLGKKTLRVINNVAGHEGAGVREEAMRVLFIIDEAGW